MSYQKIICLFIVICHFSFALSRHDNILYKGKYRSIDRGSDVLVSPDKTFTCGFFTFGNESNSYWFAIWFTNSNKTAVWVANRDKPVNGQGSRISLHKDGNLVLTDVDGQVAWASDTVNVERAELCNNGNLVLKSQNGTTLWQSFNNPTNTLLPHQTLTKSLKLVSARQQGRFDPGYFGLYFDNDNVLRLIYDGPDISSLYWPNPDLDVWANGRTTYNSSRIAALDDMGRFTSSDQWSFNASDMGYGIKRRLTLDYDGNLRLYSLDGSLWKITWEALSQPCNIHGICGENGICIYTPQPKCSCPPGFNVVNANDSSMGCRPNFEWPPFPHETVKFVEIPHTDFYGFDLNSTSTPISFEDCKGQCVNDFHCKAFSYRHNGEGVCFPKSALFNGFNSPSFPGSIYLKVPDHVNFSDSISEDAYPKFGTVVIDDRKVYVTTSRKVQWNYLIPFASAIGLIEVLIILSGSWFLYRMDRTMASVENGYTALSSQFKRFSYSELKKATKNFKEEIGHGASGAVYKGVLEDDRVVAVKRLMDVYQGEDVFWAEVSIIGNIYHINLVRMWGFCSERRHRLLVYEYVENQSLDKHLFSVNFLGWKERFKVALGTAKGLAYLHHECLEWVIHCDIKPENILLDKKIEPKVADFGLAKLSKRGSPITEFSQIRGTKGYMAPEWASNSPITAKVDVYSYGVVILELVRGVRLSNSISLLTDDNEEHLSEFTRFVKTMKTKIQCGQDLCADDIVDQRLEGQFNQYQVTELVKIGICCIDEDRSKRPTMDNVVQVLLKCEEAQGPDEL